MYKSVRQSMAWLHSWLGLTFGWLVFAIFLTGAVTYYRAEISLWMQPELANIQINQDVAIQSAYNYLQTHATDAKTWYIGVAHTDTPVNKIYWQKQDGGYESKTLDAATGQELKLSTTQGGDFFYRFHYQLYGFPALIGRLIVTIAAFMMLIILISGIITHKKIFTDFFTLRAFKGQRSYLDFHNVSSVIALPFFLTITFTGLAIFFYIALPSGMKKLYPDNPFQYFEDIRTVRPSEQPIAAVKASMQPIQYFIDATKQSWGTTEIASITLKNPNTTLAEITLVEKKDQSITQHQAQMVFNAATATVLKNQRNESPVATIHSGMYGLHMAHFAEPILRLALFFSGLLGCAMIASGLLLWSLKRNLQRKSQQFHFGHYLVHRLNIAIIIGLPIAMLSYLYSNRLFHLPVSMPNYEIYNFFAMWLLCFILGCLTPQSQLWKSQLKILMTFAFFLPLLNLYYLLQKQHIGSLSEYWVFLRIDLMIWIFAALAFFLHQNIVPIQQKAVRKVKAKLETIQEESLS